MPNSKKRPEAQFPSNSASKKILFTKHTDVIREILGLHDESKKRHLKTYMILFILLYFPLTVW